MPISDNFAAALEKNKGHMAEHFSGWKRLTKQQNRIPCSTGDGVGSQAGVPNKDNSAEACPQLL